MSKEEFLKTQTCVLKVNIHCEGCKQKVKKTLHKIEGVYTVTIDADLGKVTVVGNVHPDTLIKKLNKNGKFSELWGGAKPSNAIDIINQMKNLGIGIGNGKLGNFGGNNKNQPPKGQLNLQHIKGIQDLKSQMKVPGNGKDPKSLKFDLPEEEDLSDDEFESGDDESEDYDDADGDDDFEDEDELEAAIESKPKPGNTPQFMMKNMLNQAKKGSNLPVPINFSNIAKKPSGNGAQIHGKGGKNSGGLPDSKNSTGAPAKHGGVAPNFLGNIGPKKSMNDGPNGMSNIKPTNNPSSAIGNLDMPHSFPNLPSFPVTSAGNPQQQYAAMMMNSQRASGNERFQPMVYARPPPAVSYMPSSYPPPYTYYPADDHSDHYTTMFSDENTQSCTIM